MPLPVAMTALRSRSGLRRVLVAYVFYNLVELACWLGIVMWAYDVGGASLAGTAAVVQLIPAAGLAPLLASLGDRMPRGRALVLSYAAVAVGVTLTWIALLADAPAWLVIAASTIITTTVAVVRPIHYACLPQLARGADELVSGNALSAVGEQLAMFAGPIIAGVVVTVSGPPAVMMLSLVASGIGTVLCLGLRLGPPEATEAQEASGLAAAFEGLRSLRGDRASLSLLALMTSGFILSGSIDVLGVVFADEVLGVGDTGAGLLIGAIGVGGLLGAAVASAFAGRRRLTPAVLVSGLVMGAFVSLVAFTSSLVPAMVLIAVEGAAAAVLMVCGRTLLQRSTDDRILSRVFAVQESASLLGLAVGAALVPLLVEWFSPAAAFVPLGLLVVVIMLFGSLSVRHLDERAVFRPLETALLRRVRFFGMLPEYDLERLAQKARWVPVRSGSDVVRQGEPGRDFFVVDEGRYAVTVDGRRKEHVLAAGDSFGEIALLRDVPRTATITATEDGRLLAIGAPEFLAAVTGHVDGHALASEVAHSYVDRDRTSS